MAVYKLPENWETFPIIEINLGGVRKKVRYDEGNNIVYLLDEQGGWTGEQASVPKPSDTPPPPPEPEQENFGENRNEPVTKSGRKKKSILTPILCAIIAVLSILLLTKGKSNTPTQKTYSVVIAMDNIQPGETIDGKLASVTISAEEYRQYAATDGLYSASEYNTIKKYVATEYIPKDGYVTYTNVGETYRVVNPWTIAGTEKVTINVPVEVSAKNLKDYLWGNRITLTVIAKRNLGTAENAPDAYRPESPEVTGSSTYQTVQTDTYLLKNVTIIDLLDAEKASLYDAYCALEAIPEVYQSECLTNKFSSQDEIEDYRPAYIKLAVLPETAEWWTEINRTKKYTISISMEVTGAECDTGHQSEVYLAMKQLFTGMAQAWTATGK